MEAARLLATAGHRVTLFEKEPQLGGTARIAALAYEPNGGLIDYLSGELQRLKVDVQLNSPVDIAALAALNPDHVIVATGAKREAPEIPGKNLKHVFDGEEMRGLLLGGDDRGLKKLNPIKRALVATSQALGLTNNINWVRVLSHLWMPLQKDIVIVGGGLAGIEIAEFLVERRRRVTVLEPSSTLSPELSIVRRARVIHLLREHGCNMLTKASVSHIDQAGVHYEHKEQWHCIKADQVIIALGADADTRVSELISKAGYGVTTIGDCRSIGYLDGAIGDARTAVSALLQPQS
jgi:2,4-dienoyl-CoA reductase (NADPH2)